MNARAVAAWSAAALTISLTTGNPVYRGLVVLIALNVLVALHRPRALLRPLVAGVCAAGVVATLITVFASHTGSHVLFRLPDAIPVLGGNVTLEALVFGLSTALGIAAAVMSGAALSVIVEPHEMVDALPRWLARSGAALGTALNLVPAVGRSATEIRDAQRMRGSSTGRIGDWPHVAVPVVLTAIEQSMALAEAMEARGYGAARRTHYVLQHWRGGDVLVAVLAVCGAMAFVALRIASVAPDWYPFPALSLPTVSLPALLACCTLAAPLAVWRR